MANLIITIRYAAVSIIAAKPVRSVMRIFDHAGIDEPPAAEAFRALNATPTSNRMMQVPFRS